MAESKKEQIRKACEADFTTFLRLFPQQMWGAVHYEIIDWWNRPDAKKYSMVMLPRDHRKSALIGFRAAQRVIKQPDVKILYISATSNLATKQLKFIKDILTSDVVRFYWPELINLEEGRREKWTETEISVDDPRRKAEAVRDPTVFAAGLTTNVVGLHCDVAILDDIVTADNAYTEDGRLKTKQQYSLLASIESANSEEWVVGTRYFPNDLYNDLAEMRVQEMNEEGELTRDESLYDIFPKMEVENVGDGTGEYLWPRQQRSDGKWFGFNQQILAEKRAKYLDPVQFRAQYYNNPNDASTALIDRDLFQYFDRRFLEQQDGRWYYKQRRLNIFAAIDFAFSLSKKADYSSVVVVGVDGEKNYYVLDIDRFKTDDIKVYFEHILKAHQKWSFRTIRAEVTTGQTPIVKSLKQDYIYKYGLSLAIDEFRPTRNDGTKEERIQAILKPKYTNRQMWHYQGGNTQTLEEELVMSRPAHDDIKDALAMAVDVAKAPSSLGNLFNRLNRAVMNKEMVNQRFGGVSG